MMSVFPDEKVLEQEYKDLSGLLSNIVSSVPMYLFVKDTGNDFRYVYASPMMEQLFGQYHGDIVGKTDFELFNDPVVAQAFRDKDLDVLKSRKTQRFVEQMIDREGVLRSIDTMKMLVPREGKDPYLLGMSWDITRQQQIEEEQQENNKRLALSCQAGKIYPWIWDVINETAELSFAKDGEIIHTFITHESFTEKIHPDEQQMYRDVVNAFARGETDSLRLSFRCHYFSDEYVWLEKIGEVYEYDKDGKPSKAIGILRDITVDKQHEEDVRAKHLAEESDRMKSAFIANMSHEIRTPLNAILGFSRIIAETENAEERLQYYDIVEKNNMRLQELINEILDLSKIESGMMEFNYAPVSLYILCEDVKNTYSFRCQPGVELVFEESDPSLVISTDRNRLFQVFSNLIGNATKFTAKGSISFGYKLKEKEIVFHVADTGSGISDDKIDKIFDRFIMANNQVQGTGLGLSISKIIVEKLGGKIAVQSKMETGTTFTFTLPYISANGDMKWEEKLTPASIKDNNRTSHQEMTILVAEDYQSNYDLIEAMLGKMYKLVHAHDGMEAIIFYEQYKPDLILMDIKMPNINGLDATKAIREMSASVPVIAVSAYAYEKDKIAAIESGCNEFLTKPVSADLLKMTINKYLKQK